MIIDDIKPSVSIQPSRNVTLGTKLYNTTTLYNKAQRYFAGMSPGIYPTLMTIDQFKPTMAEIDGIEDTYYRVYKEGQSMGLLLALTFPTYLKVENTDI